jgi:methylenetetrahydrofolate reductase (NADPH)
MDQRTKSKDKYNRTVAEALRRPRYEVIPLQGIEEQVVEHVPMDVKLTVTASPKKGVEGTLDLSGRLSKEGYEIVPHLSARLIRDEVHLEDVLGRLVEQGMREIFVIAGDAEEPAGKFEGAGGLLAAMSGLDHGIKEIGIGGYPESHPFISDEDTVRAMSEKSPYATYIISQMSFDAKVVAGWARSVRDRGVDLPIHVGVPGVVGWQKLVRISTGIGLGESARFLKKYGNTFARFFKPGGYNPDSLIKSLTPAFGDPHGNIRGFHIYTFNEVAKAETWRRKKLASLEAALTSHRDNEES